MVVESAASEVLLLLGNFARSILHHLPATAVVPLPIDSLVASGQLAALIVHLKLHIHTLIAKQSVLEHNHLRTFGSRSRRTRCVPLFCSFFGYFVSSIPRCLRHILVDLLAFYNELDIPE